MMKLTIFLAAIVLLASSAQGQLDDSGLEKCNCISTLEYRPLCASNGVTYSNPSMLECAKRCLKRNDLVKVSDSPCNM